MKNRLEGEVDLNQELALKSRDKKQTNLTSFRNSLGRPKLIRW